MNDTLKKIFEKIVTHLFHLRNELEDKFPNTPQDYHPNETDVNPISFYVQTLRGEVENLYSNYNEAIKKIVIEEQKTLTTQVKYDGLKREMDKFVLIPEELNGIYKFDAFLENYENFSVEEIEEFFHSKR